MPPKSNPPVEVERMAATNNQLKIDSLEQEDRLRRIQATVQKLEAEIAALLRKAKAMGMPLTTSTQFDHDEEVAQLEATARDIEFRNEALQKQLLILKHSPASALGKPQTSVFARKQAWAPKTQAKTKPAGKKETKGAAFVLSDEEQQKFVEELTRQLKIQQDILRKTEQETEEALMKAGANQENRWHLKTTDELRRVVKELETKTTMLQTTEDHILKTMVNDQEGHRRLKDDVQDQSRELEKLREDMEQVKARRRVMEQRKDGNKEVEAEIAERKRELAQLERENEQLRLTAFSAGHAKIAAKRNDHDRAGLAEENARLKGEVDTLRAANAEMDAESAAREAGGELGIERLRKRRAQAEADAKLLERNSSVLRDKLEAFVGLQSGAGTGRDEAAMRQAQELARRVGLPLFLHAAGAGAEAQEVDALRREVRRLRVGNASEVREIGKLRQMLELQAHLAGDWAAPSAHDAKQSESESKSVRQLAKMQRAHSHRVLQLQRRLAAAIAKNDRLKQQLAASTVDGNSLSLPVDARETSLRIEDMAAGKALVVVTLEKLVLSRAYADFGRVEPETMVLLDFFLHDTQHSPPLIGLAAGAVLRCELEVALDSLLMGFLHANTAALQLLRVRGLEFEVIAKAELPLRPLLQPDANGAMACRLPLLSLPIGAARGGDTVGEIQATVHIQASAFAELARGWLAKHRDDAPVEVATAASPMVPKTGPLSRGVKGAFERRVGETYVLAVTVQSLSSAVLPSQARPASARPRLYVMYQVLDFPLEESESVSFVESAEAASFAHAAACFRLPATPTWDRKLLAGTVEVGVFDETDASGDGLVGTASLLLAPLLSHRGIATALPLRDARGANSGYLTLDISWEAEPAPRLLPPASGMQRGKEAVREPLALLRRWVASLGLGQAEAACTSLYEEWRTEPPEGAHYDGLTEGQWLGVLRREGAKVRLLSDAQARALFHHLADDAGAGRGPRLLRREAFVEAIVWSGQQQHAAGGAAAVPEVGRSGGAGGAMEDDGEEVLPSAEFIHRAEPHSPDRPPPAEAETAVPESVQAVPPVRARGVGLVRVAVRAVRCLPALLKRGERGGTEVAVRVACMVEGLDTAEQRFDNRQVPTGFVELVKEWGQGKEEADRLKEKAADAASAVEVQLWSVPPSRDDEAAVRPLADQQLGVWRVGFDDLRGQGDQSGRTITISSLDGGEELLQATVDVAAHNLFEH